MLEESIVEVSGLGGDSRVCLGRQQRPHAMHKVCISLIKDNLKSVRSMTFSGLPDSEPHTMFATAGTISYLGAAFCAKCIRGEVTCHYQQRISQEGGQEAVQEKNGAKGRL